MGSLAVAQVADGRDDCIKRVKGIAPARPLGSHLSVKVARSPLSIWILDESNPSGRLVTVGVTLRSTRHTSPVVRQAAKQFGPIGGDSFMKQTIRQSISRIARKLESHAPSKRATVALLVLAVGLNGVFDVIVTLDAWALETNPTALALGPLGMVVIKWGTLIALLTVAGVFMRLDTPDWWLGYLTVGPAVVGLGSLLNLLRVGLKSPVGNRGVVVAVGLVALVALVWYRPTLHCDSLRQATTVVVTVTIVVSMTIAGVAPLDPVQPASAETESFSCDFSQYSDGTTSPGGWEGGEIEAGGSRLNLTDYGQVTNSNTNIDPQDFEIEASFSFYHIQSTNNSEAGTGMITGTSGNNVKASVYGDNKFVSLFVDGSQETKPMVVKPTDTVDITVSGSGDSYTATFSNGSASVSISMTKSITTSSGELYAMAGSSNTAGRLESCSASVVATTISGYVTQGGRNISDAHVDATNWPKDSVVQKWDGEDLNKPGFFQRTETTTDSNGYYELTLPSRFNGSVEVSAFHYRMGNDIQTVSAGSSQTVNFDLSLPGAAKGPNGYHVKCEDSGSCNVSNPNRLSGVVVDQNGNLVSGATVVAVGSKKPSIPEARQNVSSLTDITPPEWQPDLQLAGGNGYFNTDGLGKYAAVHRADALPSTAAYTDEADLSPLLHLPTNEPVLVSIWDASQGGRFFNQNEYDNQLPGRHQSEGTVIVEKIGANGEVLSTHTTSELTETSGGGFLDPSSFSYTRIDALPAGFYHIYPKGAQQKGPVYVAGSPTAMLEQAQEDIRGELTERSKRIKAAVDSSGLVKKEVSTGPNGTWTMPITTNATQIYAVKQPKGLDVDAQKLTVQMIGERWTEAYQTPLSERSQQTRTLLNSSVYFPSRVQTVDRGEKNVTLRMTELSAPENANISAFDNRTANLLDRIKNQSLSELPPAVQERLDELSTDRLRDHIEDKNELIDKNQRLKDRLNELQEKRDLPDEIAVNDSSAAELRGQLQAMQQTIAEMKSNAETGDSTVERGTDTISYEQPFGVDLALEDVSVTAHYSNGTSRVVPNKYLTLNDGLTGGTTVQVQDYPAPKDAASIRFDITAANAEAIGKASETVSSPTYNGSVPSIESVALSSLQPGPDERVSATIQAGEGTTITEIPKATVYAPDGTELSPSIGGKTVSWTTNGTGTHVARVTMKTMDGNQHVLPVRVQARNTDTPQPPTVRMVETPYGTLAQTGDGISGGGVDVADDGSTTITAQVPADGEIPGEVHIYTEGVSTSSSSDTTIQVVRGEDRQSVNKHITTVLHGQTLSEDAIVYRETGDETNPLTREGTEWGAVTERSGGTTIEAVTAADGAVALSINNNPSRVDRLWFSVQTQLDGLPVVGTVMPLAPASMPPPGGGSLVAHSTAPLAASADLTASFTSPLAEV